MSVYLRLFDFCRIVADQKRESENKNLKLTILRKSNDQLVKYFTYLLNSNKKDQLAKSQTIAASLKTAYLMKLSQKVQGQDKYEELGSLDLPLQRMVADFKGKRGDLLTKKLDIGGYTMTFEYSYNKFVEIDHSASLQISIENEQKASERLVKYQQREIQSASRGIMQENIKDKSKKRLILPLPPIEQLTQSQMRRRVEFYQGPCKTTNFFSCMDPSNTIQNEQLFTVIETPYKQQQ